MKSTVLSISISILFLVCSCSKSDQSEGEELQLIDVKKAFDRQEKVMLSEVAQSIEYVVLETSEECLIGIQPRIYVDGKNIIAVSGRHIYLFDRNTGKFIREISGRGKGPEEYASNIYHPYNPVREIVMARGWNLQIMGFNLAGDLIEEVHPPEGYDGFSIGIQMDSTLYAQYLGNIRGDDAHRILIFDKKGNEKFLFDNTSFYERENPNSITYYGKDAEFYNYNTTTFFKEIWNDTLFKIKDTVLVPKYHFNSGEFALNNDTRKLADGYQIAKELFWIEYLSETDDYLFFTVRYKEKNLAGYYDKKNKQTRLSNFNKDDENGFYDDLSGLAYGMPYTLNMDRELVGFIEGDVMFELLSNKDESDLPERLRSVDKDSNPIVTITKIKSD